VRYNFESQIALQTGDNQGYYTELYSHIRDSDMHKPGIMHNWEHPCYRDRI